MMTQLPSLKNHHKKSKKTHYPALNELASPQNNGTAAPNAQSKAPENSLHDAAPKHTTNQETTATAKAEVAEAEAATCDGPLSPSCTTPRHPLPLLMASNQSQVISSA
jgi:hypothetical protein